MRHGIRAVGAALALVGCLWHGGSRVHAQQVVAAGIGGAAWSQAEVAAARARCAALLGPRDIVAVAAEPLRQGGCGAPAPLLLLSVGAAPQVSFSPPPLVTCDMAAALADWIESDVQPAARAMLGGAVIRVEVMSAYSCRNAYARLQARLSEHGRANALDVGMFITETGEVAQLRTNWGDTRRDVESRLAAARSEKGQPEGGREPAPAEPVLALTPPARLGGPRAPGVAEASARQRFLRRVHAAACGHFGTVLGPEANEAHRNHFHLDMAERSVRRICE